MKNSGFTKEVIILGKGHGWNDAPFYYSYDQIQTWGINDHILSRPFDLVFDMHDVDWMLEHPIKGRSYEKYLEKVNEMEVPVIALKRHPLIPTSEAYPIDAVIKYFGVDYFTCSMDYMLAYAIYKGVRKIDIYGFHTVPVVEYSHQKASVEFWIGVALGKRVNIKVHNSQSLLKTMYQGNAQSYDGGVLDGLRYGYCVKQEVNKISVN